MSAMGAESSQMVPEQPPKSSTPTNVHVDQGREIGPSMSPLPPSDDEAIRPRPVSIDGRAKSPGRKKKKKHGKGLGGDLTPRAEASVDAAEDEEPTTESAKRVKKGKKSKKSRRDQPELEAVDGVVIGSTQPEALVDDVEGVQFSPKRKSKKRSKKKINHDDLPQQNGTQDFGPINRDATLEADEAPLEDAHQDAPGLPPIPFSGSNNSNGRKNHHDLPSPELNSPPSAQRPSINGLSRYEPILEVDADEENIEASSHLNRRRRHSIQSEVSATDARQLKPEGPANDDEEDDEELQSHFAGLATASFADATRVPVAEVRRDGDLDFGMPWLHKGLIDPNDKPVIDADLPDLEPSQVKTEPQSDTSSEDESDADSDSPAAARSDRLSQSRSRSASKASTSRVGFVGDQALGLTQTTQAPPRPTSRQSNRANAADETASVNSSSTGSNASIPARMKSPVESMNSDGSSPSQSGSGRDDARAKGSPMDVDEPVAADQDTPPKTQTRKAKLDRKRAPQPTAAAEIAVHDDGRPGVGDSGDRTGKYKEQRRRRSSDDALSSRNGHLLAARSLSGADNEPQPDELEPVDGVPPAVTAAEVTQAVVDDVDLAATASQPRSSQKRKAKRSLVSETDDADSVVAPEARLLAETDARASPQKKTKGRAPLKDVSPGLSRADQMNAGKCQTVNGDEPVPVNTVDLRENSVEPGQYASQQQSKPKGKKKRKLQPKNSLSLSQIEDEDDPTEGASVRPSFSQNPKVKSLMRGGSNETEASEIDTSMEPAVAPIQKPRKIKRKRRTQGVESEDEMESLLAAGPSKSRKKATKNGPDEDENGPTTKRRRLQAKSNGEAGKGAWTDAELNDLGNVVTEFLDAYGMSQHELNELIHEVPSKTDPVNQDFWNKAAVAVPHRKRKQVVERARRLYNNYSGRGAWTEEQKEEVHAMFEKYGQRPTYPWKEIASAINRDSKDVRDYWRNHYLVHEHQVKSRWNKEEEQRLKEIVEEALNKIRITRENDEHFKPRRRTYSSEDIDDDGLIDWQQISAAMGLTRSRQQCKWKWTDMREKGLVGDESIVLPTQPRSSGRAATGISETLANAREDYRGMNDEEKFRLVDAIHDSDVRRDGHIRWSGLVDERFRIRWKRPALKLVWYRLRQSVPSYEDQNVKENAEYLLNHYHQHRSFPRVGDNQVDQEVEEKLVHRAPGSRVWQRPSENPRAVRERQRRSSSASSHASTRLSSRVSGEILRIEGSDNDEEDTTASLGDEDDDQRGRRRHVARDDVPIMIPKHLKGETAKQALAQARAKAGKTRSNGNKPERRIRSASVAVDSDSG